ncbi:4-coumarate--CoA ligase 2-like [Harpegnathos saltator]|uniref:4-coumarate--CoA ligase 2-like n=1 Tax=Harpegnathos saltator TaxID=610380 RepID=UPI000DBEDA25|nr:4-coumarate--CoA ligase 2-like [Harpegnathos saltator]
MVNLRNEDVTDEGDLTFRTENDILIGEEAPIHTECTNVGALVLEKLRSRPEFIAQVEAVSGAETTFAEMTEKSVKCALWLREQGVQPGDIIGICTHNHLESYVPLLAALYLGAISNPWDNELSPTTASYFLLLTRPKIVFVNSESAECLKQVVKERDMDTRLVVFDASAGSVEHALTLTAVLRSQDAAAIDEFECAKLTGPDHVATIVCSSGTSGFPKGTEISHAAMINYMAHVKIHDLKGHVSMWTPSMRWYCGLFIVIKAILDCSRRIIVPDYDDDEGLCRFIEKYEVSWFRCDSCFPIRLVKFGVLSKYRLPTLKILLFGGAHFKGELQQKLVKLLPHTNVILSYGMTDYGGLCARQTKYSKPGSCGFVCETGRLKVVDPNTGKVLGANKTGEIWAKSSYMMNGYYNNPEATKRALDSDGWLHTGDLGYYDNDGEIFLVDRMSEFINYRAIKISPAEIEALIQQHPAVLQVAVVPVPHSVDEQHAMAFVAKVPGKEVTELDITDLVKQNMPWYCRLHAGVKFMERLPRTATGKIAKKELRQIAKSYVTG